MGKEWDRCTLQGQLAGWLAGYRRSLLGGWVAPAVNTCWLIATPMGGLRASERARHGARWGDELWR